MADVAVVAHSGKSFGGGLPELRTVLAREGVTYPLWYEVRKSRHAPACARRAADQGAEVIFGWGGDGTVQRCIDAVAGTDTAVAILPAGTANLLAMNLQIPDDLTQAVRVGLHGDRRRMDTGSVNGEHFAVMAGAGFDARMIAEAGRGLKDRVGRAAYLYTGIRNLSTRRVKATIEVDGERFFTGRVSCVLAANVGRVLGGSRPFPGRGRTTGSSSSAWSPRRTRSNGPGPSAGLPWATRSGRLSWRSLAGRRSRSGSAGRSRTNWTAARARPAGNCGSRPAPAPSPSASRCKPPRWLRAVNPREPRARPLRWQARVRSAAGWVRARALKPSQVDERDGSVERSSATQLPGDQERTTGQLVAMLSEQVSALIRDELKLARLEMTSKGKQAALGAGMFGTSGVIALYGVGCLLACAIIAISGVVAAWLAALVVGAALFAAAGCAALLGKRRVGRAAPPVPEQAVASVKADIEEIKERAHR